MKEVVTRIMASVVVKEKFKTLYPTKIMRLFMKNIKLLGSAMLVSLALFRKVRWQKSIKLVRHY